jgi:hypothetical protein
VWLESDEDIFEVLGFGAFVAGFEFFIILRRLFLLYVRCDIFVMHVHLI